MSFKRKKLFILALTGVFVLLICVACGKKNSDSQPQSQQSIVPTNVFAQIPGTKVGN